MPKHESHLRFHNPDLQREFDHIAPSLEAFVENLDHASSDIKNLETKLSDYGVRIDVSVPISEGESIEWGPFGEKGRWRLVYRETPDDQFADDHVTPLIETAVATRMKACKVLHVLVRDIGKVLTYEPKKEEDFNLGEVPF